LVEKISPGPKSIELIVRSKICAHGAKVGDSLAVNGCCLTITKIRPARGAKLLHFDLLRETWQRTNLQFTQTGASVNFERALPADGRIGGHFVTGHIDGLGKIIRWERSGADHVLEIAAPPELLRLIVFKGSIAVDGISLTVSAVTKKYFQVWIIPHTYNVTALRERKVGDAVNLETDLLGKYVERLISGISGQRS
jgi:riboflavin synthase